MTLCDLRSFISTRYNSPKDWFFDSGVFFGPHGTYSWFSFWLENNNFSIYYLTRPQEQQCPSQATGIQTIHHNTITLTVIAYHLHWYCLSLTIQEQFSQIGQFHGWKCFSKFIVSKVATRQVKNLNLPLKLENYSIYSCTYCFMRTGNWLDYNEPHLALSWEKIGKLH